MKLIKLSSDHYIIINESEKDTYTIPLSEVKELLGEVDVENMANEYADRQLKGMVDKSSKFECVNDFITGYNQALEDNKDRKYTEEDMRRAYYKGATDCHDKCTERNWRGVELKVSVDSLIDLCSTYIQSLQPPTSWDVQFINGKLKLV